jgi:hypothetical protein
MALIFFFFFSVENRRELLRYDSVFAPLRLGLLHSSRMKEWLCRHFGDCWYCHPITSPECQEPEGRTVSKEWPRAPGGTSTYCQVLAACKHSTPWLLQVWLVWASIMMQTEVAAGHQWTQVVKPSSVHAVPALQVLRVQKLWGHGYTNLDFKGCPREPWNIGRELPQEVERVPQRAPMRAVLSRPVRPGPPLKSRNCRITSAL